MAATSDAFAYPTAGQIRAGQGDVNESNKAPLLANGVDEGTIFIAAQNSFDADGLPVLKSCPQLLLHSVRGFQEGCVENGFRRFKEVAITASTKQPEGDVIRINKMRGGKQQPNGMGLYQSSFARAIWAGNDPKLRCGHGGTGLTSECRLFCLEEVRRQTLCEIVR